MEYNHKEAFCLMIYRCNVCGRVEKLWNSRDGVTPFIIGCRFCGGEAMHIMWNSDMCVPDYEPHPRQRIFVDMTKEKATEIAEKIIKMREPNKIQETEKEQMLKNLIERIYVDGKAPDIITIE